MATAIPDHIVMGWRFGGWMALACALSACGQSREAPASWVPASPEAPAAIVPLFDAPPRAPEHARNEALSSRFFGEDDAGWRRSLASSRVARIRRGRGGRTLAFRITLEDGTKGYYKPEQTFSGAHWYSELAAYYLDRELGFGRVPPSIGRRLRWPPLRRVANEDARIPEVVVAEDETVRGAFIHWIDGALPPWELGARWERWLRLTPMPMLNPWQRTSDWRAVVNGRVAPDSTAAAMLPQASEDPPSAERVAELSDLLIFDTLIANVDRWSPDYTNVRLRGRGGPLVFLDNGAGFWLGRHRLDLMDARLGPLQRFRKATVEALRAFDLRRFRRRIAADPLAPVLTESQIEGLEVRRRQVLEHVAAMRGRFGDDVFIDPQ